MQLKQAKFHIGQVVKHRIFPFRGVIFDVDPFYHLLAENDETEYVAYVSEQNLLIDDSDNPVRHPQLAEFFDAQVDGTYKPKERVSH